MIFHELPPPPPGLSKRQQRKRRVALLLEGRLIADAARRGPPDRKRRIPRHARGPFDGGGCACPVNWGEFHPLGSAFSLVEDAEGSMAAAIASIPMVRMIVGIGDHLVAHVLEAAPVISPSMEGMNRAMAESRGDPWPPVHRKPLQHRPGCRDAACVGCR